MNITELCKTRPVGETARETPLLVPSFSSRGFAVGPLFEDTWKYCQNSKLVSAYDLHYRTVGTKNLYSADVLFIDSGHYEKTPTHNPGEPAEDQRPGKQTWTISKYASTLHSISTDRCQIVRVTYDLYRPINIQIARALSSRRKHPAMLLDFLVKPTTSRGKRRGEPSYLDPRLFAKFAPRLGFADIIGFTEKELGPSYRERALTLAQIRHALNNAGIDRPIHVFGCLDPFGVLLYHAVGADIFDGLSWLRFAWADGLMTYIPNSVALIGSWGDPLESATRATQIRNLTEVTKMEAAARSVSRLGSFDGIQEPWKRYALRVSDLLKDIGVEIGGA
jgi:hypothetical protein